MEWAVINNLSMYAIKMMNVPEGETNIILKPWGAEHLLVNTPKYSLKLLMCYGNKWSSDGMFHYHKKKDETFLVIDGKLELETIDATYILTEGQGHRIGPGQLHRFRSSQAFFLETATHCDNNDSYRIPIPLRSK